MGDPCSPRATGKSSHDWLWRLGPAAPLICAVALYNHLPLAHPDTGNYLENSSTIAHGPRPWFLFRPLTYSAFLVPFAALSLFTSLPWSSDQIMPDCFTGAVCLLCFVSVWGDDERRTGARWAIGVPTGLGSRTSQ